MILRKKKNIGELVFHGKIKLRMLQASCHIKLLPEEFS